MNQESRGLTGFGPLTDKVIGSVLDKLSQDDFRTMASQKVIDPLFVLVVDKAKPYIYAGIAMYILVVVLLIFIIYLLLKKKH